ncbi:MAG: 2-oxoacid:acceptor oxidoreductase family protein, partial [Thermodesulfobacteriota bacterium]
MQDKLIKILIPAVGGQGGGVLAEWLIQAFQLENFDVQGISLPGLSQRGGSTIYYMEAYPRSGSENIIFSQYPLPGDIDLILSQEFLELGRVLEQGFGSEKTTIVSSTHRIYSTQEKLPISGGIYSEENLQKIAEEFSSSFIGLDVLQLAKDNGMNELSTNAILLGALSSSQAIPISKETFQKAIEAAGVSIKNNLNAFNVGYEHVTKNGNYNVSGNEPEEHDDELYKYLNEKDKKRVQNLIAEVKESYPEFLLPYLSEALIRLTDYQGF